MAAFSHAPNDALRRRTKKSGSGGRKGQMARTDIGGTEGREGWERAKSEYDYDIHGFATIAGHILRDTSLLS